MHVLALFKRFILDFHYQTHLFMSSAVYDTFHSDAVFMLPIEDKVLTFYHTAQALQQVITRTAYSWKLSQHLTDCF